MDRISGCLCVKKEPPNDKKCHSHGGIPHQAVAPILQRGISRARCRMHAVNGLNFSSLCSSSIKAFCDDGENIAIPLPSFVFPPSIAQFFFVPTLEGIVNPKFWTFSQDIKSAQLQLGRVFRPEFREYFLVGLFSFS